jgi:hypothetical protein
MAVTQQLARLSEENLIKCLHNKKTIMELLDFTLLSECDYLDLNWEVTYLKSLINRYCYGSATIYNESIDGIHEFPESLGVQDVEEQPTYNNSDDVQNIADKLTEINIRSVLVNLPKTLDEINRILGSHYDDVPHEYLAETFLELTSFYKGAKEKKYCMVCWWD